jgi:hypothetical protein
MYQLFPYQYSFYNNLVGGIEGADGKYEVDVWRSALREALRKLSVVVDSSDVVRIYTCGNALNFEEYPRFRLIEWKRREDADYIVTLRRECNAENLQIWDLPVIGEIRRQGVLFAAIYSRPPQGWPGREGQKRQLQ